jgi:hypothetical protein
MSPIVKNLLFGIIIILLLAILIICILNFKNKCECSDVKREIFIGGSGTSCQPTAAGGEITFVSVIEYPPVRATRCDPTSQRCVSNSHDTNYPCKDDSDCSWAAGNIMLNSLHTGCSYFEHTKNPDIVTFVFSAGRHELGYNTYMTIDFSKNISPDVQRLQEQIIDFAELRKDKNANNTGYSWVSTKTIGDTHYALFAGDEGIPGVTPSLLYSFTEKDDGELTVQKLFTQKDLGGGGSRFCLVEQIKGTLSLILLGSYGVQIYSQGSSPSSFSLTHTIPLSDLGTTASACLGAKLYKNRYLIVGTRSAWKSTDKQSTPNFIYDLDSSAIVSTFGDNCQTVSIDTIKTGTGSYIITGNGGEANFAGAPNIMYEFDETTSQTNALDGREQISPSLHTKCPQYLSPSSITYNNCPDVNDTKTRQVLVFQMGSESGILVINSGQSCYILTPNPNGDGMNRTYIPNYQISQSQAIARAGTVYPHTNGDYYIILAMYNGQNVIYKFSPN